MSFDRGRIVYYAAVSASSILLFSIQPIITKAILPAFGGSASVWVTAMLFFQSVLLLGYGYAWLITRFLSPRLQSVVHAGILILSLVALSLLPHIDLQLANANSPLLSILLVLASSVGLPYLLLCSTSPLLQSWLGSWRLYALSNAASVVALLAYPVLIEPISRVSAQLRFWSAGYAVVVVIVCVAAALNKSKQRVEVPTNHSSRHPLLWIGLATCGSVLWLAVANHLSQEVAPVPFLWVLPLSIYLLSFILCFESDSRWYRPSLFRWLLPVAWVVGGYSIASGQGFVPQVAGFSFALFVWCMFCQGELARSKPANTGELTFFYLTVAVGGALGGLLVAVAAPMVFRSYLELPIGIAASFLLAMPLVYGVRSKTRIIRLAVVAVAAFIVATTFRDLTGTILEERNFYGALQVIDSGSGDLAFRSLYNGRTLHGMEFLSREKNLVPTAYYGPDSGAGKALSIPVSGPRRVGIVGLGVGTVAAYGHKGDLFRFYEINPAVVQIASEQFHFLGSSAAHIDVLTGDGRLLLEKEPPDSFDVLLLDAFSDDSIPVHLMTREAFRLYTRLLRHDGVLAIHLTNRYIDLDPVVDALAAGERKRVVHVHSVARPEEHVLDADWAIVFGRDEAPPHHEDVRHLWTDDYSNLFSVLK